MMMTIAKRFGLGLVCVASLAASAPAEAQQKFVQLLTIHAKPEGAVEFEAYVKKVNAAALKVGQNQRNVVYQVTSGGPGYTYMVASYFDKWSETDEILSTPEVLNKALGELEGGRVLRAGRSNIHSTETAVYRLLPELSTKPKAYDPPPANLQVIRSYVKPGMTREWERVIARVKAAQDQNADAPTALRRVSVEGPANVYVTSSPYSKGAERDAWPAFIELLTKAYGPEEAGNLDERRGACLERAEAFIMKYRPDLSRLGS